jgi:hypothetical protein
MNLNRIEARQLGETANVEGHRVNRSMTTTRQHVSTAGRGMAVSALALVLTAGMATAMQPAGDPPGAGPAR